MLYVFLEVVMLKYYGEGEWFMVKIFNVGNEFFEGVIVFLDEFDFFVIS